MRIGALDIDPGGNGGGAGIVLLRKPPKGIPLPELYEAGADEPRHQRLPGGGIGGAGGGQPLRLLELAQSGLGDGAEAAVGAPKLAEKLRIEPSTATRSIERLVKAGLACRRPSAEDGRVVEVELTPEGRAIYKDVAVRRLKLIASALAGFEPAEREAFVGMLERYVGLVDRFVEERILKPLKMHDTGYSVPAEKAARGARPHRGNRTSRRGAPPGAVGLRLCSQTWPSV